MESHAKLLGHAAHPILVTFPLGLLGTSVPFDLAGASLKRKDLQNAGFWMAAAGVVTGAVAAIPGLIDYLAIPEGTRAKRIGLLHGVGNAVVIGLFLASLSKRTKRPHVATKASNALAGAGLLLAFGTGWLGGELVERLGVGVDDDADLNATNSLAGYTPQQ